MTANPLIDLERDIEEVDIRIRLDGNREDQEAWQRLKSYLTAPTAAVVPEPAFRLTWRDGQYRVSKPNIGDTDCYTAEQVRALLQAQPAAVPDGMIAVYRDDLAALLLDDAQAFQPGTVQYMAACRIRTLLAAAQGVNSGR